MFDAGRREAAGKGGQGGRVRDGQQDEMGVIDPGRDQPVSGGLDGRVDGLDGPLRRR